MRTGTQHTAMTHIALEKIKEAEQRRNAMAATGVSYHARLHDGFMLYQEYMHFQREQNVLGDASEERIFHAPLREQADA